MVNKPGHETGSLSPGTMANYKVRLKKLWLIYPTITDEEQRELCMQEMLKLSDKTGIELGGPMLLRGPGAPRKRLVLDAEQEKKLASGELLPTPNKEQVVDSEKELHRMAILAKHGVTPERLEKIKQAKKESQENKKEQELKDAVEYALTNKARVLERPLTDQERAMIETEVLNNFRQRAEEERLSEQGPTTGS